MPRPRSGRRPQMALYETTRDDPELEAALKTRESMLQKRSEANHNFKVADDAVQKKIEALELGHDAAVRVGDFVITSKATKGGHVEFDRNASTRIRIKLLSDD